MPQKEANVTLPSGPLHGKRYSSSVPALGRSGRAWMSKRTLRGILKVSASARSSATSSLLDSRATRALVPLALEEGGARRTFANHRAGRPALSQEGAESRAGGRGLARLGGALSGHGLPL
eukprot:15446603-Alexandrium_andersonii.AAC.1